MRKTLKRVIRAFHRVDTPEGRWITSTAREALAGCPQALYELEGMVFIPSYVHRTFDARKRDRAEERAFLALFS
jgi:hypothetical protein